MTRLEELINAKVDAWEWDDIRSTLTSQIVADRYGGDFTPILPKVRRIAEMGARA